LNLVSAIFSVAWVDLFLNVVCKLCNSSEDANLQLWCR